ncbi:hypothetical protein ONS95_004491 [Cadophora gregata]|uniref:uncharacterized protein n=1 Tax=Cadophora gregata TaxID=51156 RepID=UPI0026DABE6E|nr:uncharacterized protein ONS95_004491 [Cadophora gregata]KAK0105984.1 hypothetical protein ONS95_004491 [Cadophora gregata]
MWKPPINFITLHYAYIIALGIVGFIIIYPYGNMPSVDAYFFGVSASTESGLNTIDVKALKTYQQLVIYFIPIIGNLGFINIVVVLVRLVWFEKRLKKITSDLVLPRRRDDQIAPEEKDCEGQTNIAADRPTTEDGAKLDHKSVVANGAVHTPGHEGASLISNSTGAAKHITFGPESGRHEAKATRVSTQNPEEVFSEDEDETIKSTTEPRPSGLVQRRRVGEHSGQAGSSTALARVASSMFVVGVPAPRLEDRPIPQPNNSASNIPYLSRQATVGRNSQFHQLTNEDRLKLGGIEYRSLRLLLKIVLGYFFGLHIFGAICLVGWIQYAPAKYTEYLQETGQNKIWWAFYSSQTMMDNLGFTLTPDSMITFQDATFPMLIMTFLAYAGNTFYPIFLRLVIWTASKLVPKTSSLKEPLQFLLDHPRRCYTLLFPSHPTWILFGILFVMNFVDVLLIIVLDLHNDAVANLSPGPRLLAAIFQAASARHTGTSTFNLAEVNPAVQFSLLVMMYIAVFPIAISVRASNTYEEKSLGLYSDDRFDVDEHNPRSYVMMHLRNQLSFDLWYIFFGIFCICVAEADKITDLSNPVRISQLHPTVNEKTHKKTA